MYFFVKDSVKPRLTYLEKFKTDSIGQIIERYTYYWKEENLIESEDFTKYFYNSEGNIIKTHSFGLNSESIDEYEYDNMYSPFKNLDLPFSNSILPMFEYRRLFRD